MAFGMTSSGRNGLLGINSDWPSVVYVGKAAWTGAGSAFPADHPSVQLSRNFGPYNPSSSQASIVGMGKTVFYAYAETARCGAQSGTLPTPDDNGFFLYFIDSPALPHVFLHTSRPDVFATVLGIRNTYTYGANGWPRWSITICAGYPAGMRTGALPYLSLYCFTPTYDTQPPGVGMRAYDANNRLVFNSKLNPIRVKDILTIHSTTITGTEISTMRMNSSTLPNPVAPAAALAKPAFLNVDWARYRVNSVIAMGALNRLVAFMDGRLACQFRSYSSVRCSVMYIAAGVRLAADKTFLYGLTGLQSSDCSIGADQNSSTSVAKFEALPVNIPIIEGTDYD